MLRTLSSIRYVYKHPGVGKFKTVTRETFPKLVCTNPCVAPPRWLLSMKYVDAACYPLHTYLYQRSLQTAANGKETKTLTVWNDLKEVRRSPVSALTLGLAGLIPFVSVPTYLIMSGFFSPSFAFAQASYGASILSFLGGIRWGFSIREETSSTNWKDLGYSVTPSLIAWNALLLPTQLSFVTVTGGLVFAAYSDISMCGYPPWFKGLRLLLTFVAVFSLLSTLMCSFLLKENLPTVKKDVTTINNG